MSTFLPQDSNDNPIPVMSLKTAGAHSISAATGASARNSTAFDGDTRVISVYTDTDIYMIFGDSSITADAADHFFPAGLYYDFAIGGENSVHNTHLAVLAASLSGTVYISEKK